MPINVLAQCPSCKITKEHTTPYLDAVALATKEAWVIECSNCGCMFLHRINNKAKESE